MSYRNFWTTIEYVALVCAIFAPFLFPNPGSVYFIAIAIYAKVTLIWVKMNS